MRKELFRVFVTTALIFSLAVTSVNMTSAAGLPYISVDPQTTTKGVGMSFDINVTVTDITLPDDLYSWEARLAFDPEILNCTGAEEGPFLKQIGLTWWWLTIQNEQGWVDLRAAFRVRVPQGATGSGTLATVTFQVLAMGSTPLNFSETKLSTVDKTSGVSQPIDQADPVPGLFTNVARADVAITNVTASPTTVLAGNLLNVSVTVKNEGTVTPTDAPTVKIYFTNATHLNIPIIDFNVVGLENGTERTESRSWNATEFSFYWGAVESRISPGTYTLSAEVSSIEVGGLVESDLEDNVFPRGHIPPINVTVGASLISISVNPATVTLGSSTAIKGSITPTRSDVSVTIKYRLSGEEGWSTIKTVTTDEKSAYSCNWKPETTGTYEVMASWEGDNNALPSESEILTINVEAASPIILYVVAAVAMIIAAAIVIYFLRFRKPKPT